MEEKIKKSKNCMKEAEKKVEQIQELKTGRKKNCLVDVIYKNSSERKEIKLFIRVCTE